MATIDLTQDNFEQVVSGSDILYSEAGSLPAPALEQVINQARGVDMAAVHKEIAERGAEA